MRGPRSSDGARRSVRRASPLVSAAFHGGAPMPGSFNRGLSICVHPIPSQSHVAIFVCIQSAGRGRPVPSGSMVTDLSVGASSLKLRGLLFVCTTLGFEQFAILFGWLRGLVA